MYILVYRCTEQLFIYYDKCTLLQRRIELYACLRCNDLSIYPIPSLHYTNKTHTP